jgi:hypothetical protein
VVGPRDLDINTFQRVQSQATAGAAVATGLCDWRSRCAPVELFDADYETVSGFTQPRTVIVGVDLRF